MRTIGRPRHARTDVRPERFPARPPARGRGHDRLNGLEFEAALEAYYGTEINHSRLYPSLDDLADNGLVEKGSIDQRTNYYSVTQRDRRELESHHQRERQLVGEETTR